MASKHDNGLQEDPMKENRRESKTSYFPWNGKRAWM